METRDNRIKTRDSHEKDPEFGNVYFHEIGVLIGNVYFYWVVSILTSQFLYQNIKHLRNPPPQTRIPPLQLK